MSIRYSDRPQLIYGRSPTANTDLWQNRFPANAQPIASAPERSVAPIYVFEPSGEAHPALFYRGQWMKIAPERDQYTGATRWRMSGESVVNPVCWASS